MLYSIDGSCRAREVTYTPYNEEFNLWRSRLTIHQIEMIRAELREMIDGHEIHTAGWMPGSDWSGTVWEPIYPLRTVQGRLRRPTATSAPSHCRSAPRRARRGPRPAPPRARAPPALSPERRSRRRRAVAEAARPGSISGRAPARSAPPRPGAAGGEGGRPPSCAGGRRSPAPSATLQGPRARPRRGRAPLLDAGGVGRHQCNQTPGGTLSATLPSG